MPLFRPLLAILFLSALLACGVGGDDGVFVVTPETPTAVVGSKVTLALQPMTDLAGEPQWETQELQGGAFLRSRGLSVTYISPAVAGTYHLVITGRQADGRALRQVLEVQVLPVISLEPASGSVAAGGSLPLTSRVRGTSRQELRWSVEEENGGKVDAHGVYTAPVTPGVYHVRGELEEFPGAVGRAAIRVD